MKRILLFILTTSISLTIVAQNFQVRLEPLQIDNMPGLQAFAFGEHNGEWILIGGRTDGLHQRQPFASFDAQGNNTSIYLVNPTQNTVKSTSVSTLSTTLKEQLQSTNMEFKQVGDKLYVIGGYGYADSKADHITHPYLTIVDLSGLATAIKNNTPIAPYFQQIADEKFAVTGGYLEMLDGVFYLVAGNRFDGRYNPMGHNTYTQEYTEQIRVFTVTEGATPTVNWQTPITDATNLHRRDYNLTPQIFPSGEKGFTAWAGVFQKTVDLPFLNSVDITAKGHTVNNYFNQYLNQYHSAQLPIYEGATQQMTTVFFGGIAQFYYDANNTLVKDDDVPFVNTISSVTRFSNSSMYEKKLGEMESFLGASAEFIPASNAFFNGEEIFMLDSLNNGDSLMVGYIVGGIKSTAANIFFINDGTQSAAHKTVYKVFIRKQQGVSGITVVQPTLFKAKVYAPHNGSIFVELTNAQPQKYTIVLTDISGKHINSTTYASQQGKNLFQLDSTNLAKGVYMLSIHSGQVYKSYKVIVP